MKEYKGELISKGYKYALVISRFNSFITEKLLEGALDALLRSGAKKDEIDIIRVPGALKFLLQQKEVRNPVNTIQ